MGHESYQTKNLETGFKIFQGFIEIRDRETNKISNTSYCFCAYKGNSHSDFSHSMFRVR